jgi:hypothetical protein
LQGLSEGGRKNIASFVGICTTVRTDSNDRGVRVLAIGTLDIPCGTFAVNYRLGLKFGQGSKKKYTDELAFEGPLRCSQIL